MPDIDELTALTSLTASDLLVIHEIATDVAKKMTRTNFLADILRTSVREAGSTAQDGADETAIRTAIDSARPKSVLTNSADDATGAIAFLIGNSGETEGFGIYVYDEIITLDITVGTTTGLTVPQDAIIRAVLANCTTEINPGVGNGAAYAIGTSGDGDKYGESSALTQNNKITELLPKGVTALTAAEEIYVTLTNGSGVDASAPPTAGAVRVWIAYEAALPLDDV